MPRSDVFDRVKTILIEHLDCDPDKVVEQASLVDDLGADSLDHVELTMTFEEEFDTEISDAEAERCNTVGATVNLIYDKIKERDTGASINGE